MRSVQFLERMDAKCRRRLAFFVADHAVLATGGRTLANGIALEMRRSGEHGYL